MSAPMKAFSERTLIDAIVQEFIRPLRAPKAGIALAADKQLETGDWGDENITWDELSEMGHVTLSMDLPPVRAEGMGSTQQTVESPVWTKDLKWGGRDWRSLLNSVRRRALLAERGFDRGLVPDLEAMFMEEMGEAMAAEMDAQILTGSGTGLPGSDEGVLNQTGRINITDAGDWRDPDVLNSDIGDALAQVADRNYTGTGWALLHNPADKDVFTELTREVGQRRAAEVLGLDASVDLTRRLESDQVNALEAFLVPDTNHKNSWFWAHPEPDPENGFQFGLGTATPGRVDNAPPMDVTDPGGTVQERRDQFFKTRIVRMLNIGTVMNVRTGTGDGGSGVARLAFSKS